MYLYDLMEMALLKVYQYQSSYCLPVNCCMQMFSAYRCKAISTSTICFPIHFGWFSTQFKFDFDKFVESTGELWIAYKTVIYADWITFLDLIYGIWSDLFCSTIFMKSTHWCYMHFKIVKYDKEYASHFYCYHEFQLQ